MMSSVIQAWENISAAFGGRHPRGYNLKSNRFDENIGAVLLNKPERAGESHCKSYSLCRNTNNATERT